MTFGHQVYSQVAKFVQSNRDNPEPGMDVTELTYALECLAKAEARYNDGRAMLEAYHLRDTILMLQNAHINLAMTWHGDFDERVRELYRDASRRAVEQYLFNAIP